MSNKEEQYLENLQEENHQLNYTYEQINRIFIEMLNMANTTNAHVPQFIIEQYEALTQNNND